MDRHLEVRIMGPEIGLFRTEVKLSVGFTSLLKAGNMSITDDEVVRRPPKAQDNSLSNYISACAALKFPQDAIG